MQISRLYPLLLNTGMVWGAALYFGFSIPFFLLLIICFTSAYCKSFGKKIELKILIIILISAIIILSNYIYTISSSASVTKILQLFYCLLFFIVGTAIPISNNLKSFFNQTITVYCFVILVYFMLFIFVAKGDIYIFKGISTVNDIAVIPNYLLMALVGYPLLIWKISRSEFDKYFVFISISCLFVLSLGGRGPLLFLLIVMLLHIIKDFKKNYKLLVLCLFFGLFVVSFTNILDVFLQRMASIDKDISLLKRYVEYESALTSISEKPIMGFGIGSSGILLGYGDVYAYPHNVLLESWLELGVFGLAFSILLYLSIVYLCLFTSPRSICYPLYLICLFLLLNALKSGSLYEQRYLYFYLGLIWTLRFNNRSIIRVSSQ